jgi:hypothetical protein
VEQHHLQDFYDIKQKHVNKIIDYVVDDDDDDDKDDHDG